MDRRQLLIGSGAAAFAGTMIWSPRAMAETNAPGQPVSNIELSPLHGGVNGVFTLNAASIVLNGTLVPAL
ncbi:hypothetical protein P1X14_09395 [Sphingomonas sp. AOB5]|uniref:hypothetical protein n=1 Tax=Sphingomonas sp. AOB5 TaxID=3034017 RepID=UPI0023F97706|nr:hypothetical protein [Sphingomonas sp. AOB5]MDF7775461.1 hypothetical protein [Sphingomonas sp. AOB5]